MSRNTKPISWVKAARKAFETFPEGAQVQVLRALTVAAEGERADIAKPMKGLGPGVCEIAVKFRTDAYRAVYALQIGEAVWVVHAFQKKSRKGIETPRHEVDVIKERIKRLKETLR